MSEGLKSKGCYASGKQRYRCGMSNKRQMTVTVDPREVRTRDWAMVRLINGATKAGVQPDRRKEADRRACRGRRGRDGD